MKWNRARFASRAPHRCAGAGLADASRACGVRAAQGSSLRSEHGLGRSASPKLRRTAEALAEAGRPRERAHPCSRCQPGAPLASAQPAPERSDGALPAPTARAPFGGNSPSEARRMTRRSFVLSSRSSSRRSRSRPAPRRFAPSAAWSSAKARSPLMLASRSSATAATPSTRQSPPRSRSRSASNRREHRRRRDSWSSAWPPAIRRRSIFVRRRRPDRILEMWLQDGEAQSQLHHNSYRAVGVPGTVAGMHLAWKTLGSKPWKDLVASAVKLARDGFEVSDALARSLERTLDRQEIPGVAGAVPRRTAPLSGGRHPEAARPRTIARAHRRSGASRLLRRRNRPAARERDEGE